MKKKKNNPNLISPNTYGASDFKAHCLELLDRVRERGEEYIITKHGEPVAKIVPVKHEFRPLGGSLKGLIEIDDDIVEVNFADDWEILREP